MTSSLYFPVIKALAKKFPEGKDGQASVSAPEPNKNAILKITPPFRMIFSVELDTKEKDYFKSLHFLFLSPIKTASSLANADASS